MQHTSLGSHLDEHSEELTIRFDPSQNEYAASAVLGWTASVTPLTGKTVLLGGKYKHSDEHETPLGSMAGVEIWANILETELEGGGYRPLPWYALLILGFVESILLVFLFQVWSFKRGLVTSIIALPLVAVAFSFIVYHSARRWAYFALILATLIVGQWIEMMREERTRQIEKLFKFHRKAEHETNSETRREH